MNKLCISFFLVLLVAIGVLSCAGPSPWANLVPPEYTGLTKKHLRKLSKLDSEFKQFRVGLIADPQVFPGFLRKVIKTLDRRGDIDFQIVLGDLTDRSLRTEFLWVAEAIESSSTPVLTVAGNHDGLIYGKELYSDLAATWDDA